jgi:hypothetical protein
LWYSAIRASAALRCALASIASGSGTALRTVSWAARRMASAM